VGVGAHPSWPVRGAASTQPSESLFSLGVVVCAQAVFRAGGRNPVNGKRWLRVRQRALQGTDRGDARTTRRAWRTGTTEKGKLRTIGASGSGWLISLAGNGGLSPVSVLTLFKRCFNVMPPSRLSAMADRLVMPPRTSAAVARNSAPARLACRPAKHGPKTRVKIFSACMARLAFSPR
jgi:hypothetical protein